MNTAEAYSITDSKREQYTVIRSDVGILYLPKCSSKLSFRIFADDTNMFYASNNLHSDNLESVMNEELKSIVKYCAINKLSINFSKTNYILVSSSRLSGSINVNNIKIKSQI